MGVRPAPPNLGIGRRALDVDDPTIGHWVRRPCCTTTTGPAGGSSQIGLIQLRRPPAFRTISRRGTPTDLIVRSKSLPVSDNPAEFQPTQIHGPIPSVNTTGSPTPSTRWRRLLSRRRDEVVAVRPTGAHRGRRRTGVPSEHRPSTTTPAVDLPRPAYRHVLDRGAEGHECVVALSAAPSIRRRATASSARVASRIGRPTRLLGASSPGGQRRSRRPAQGRHARAPQGPGPISRCESATRRPGIGLVSRA